MKNKVVIVHPDRGARIYITTNPENFACLPEEELLVNPNTKMVDNLPPELWKCVDGKLLPITEEGEVSRRMMKLETLPRMVKAVADHDKDLGDVIATIESIPLQLAEIQERIDAMELALAYRISTVFEEVRHQRNWFIIIVVLIILSAIAGRIF
jgi:hypothetical protein